MQIDFMYEMIILDTKSNWTGIGLCDTISRILNVTN